MNVNCLHALETEVPGCVKCALNLYGGFPSDAVCIHDCSFRQEINEITKGKHAVIENIQVKFNTCKHRSRDLIQEAKASCCGRSEIIEGYKCHLLNIIPLNASICLECKSYEPES
jgi:hypothetical protein